MSDPAGRAALEARIKEWLVREAPRADRRQDAMTLLFEAMVFLSPAGGGTPPPEKGIRNLDTPENREFWASVDRAVTEWRASEPEWSKQLRAGTPPEGAQLDNGNTFVFCDAVEGGAPPVRSCVRGAGHNGPHAFCLPPLPQEPVILRAAAPPEGAQE